MFMPRSACAGASSILLRFLGCTAAFGAWVWVCACGSGVAFSLAGSGVCVSFPGSGFTDGDFSIDGRGVDGAARGACGMAGVATAAGVAGAGGGVTAGAVGTGVARARLET